LYTSIVSKAVKYYECALGHHPQFSYDPD